MPSENEGVMIVLSSPSGAGKTTLVKMLSKIDNYEVSISHTTRQPRLNEEKLRIQKVMVLPVLRVHTYVSNGLELFQNGTIMKTPNNI